MRRLSLQDAIGLRGESIFFVALTKLYGRTNPLFNPRFLGEKYPSVDYIVELIDPSAQIIPYFFVQVKTTRAGYTKRRHRLKAAISSKDMLPLALLPAPTYVVGVDEVNEVAYIVAANRSYTQGLSSISTQFPLNQQTQENLFLEVREFWSRFDKIQIDSLFIDKEWG